TLSHTITTILAVPKDHKCKSLSYDYRLGAALWVLGEQEGMHARIVFSDAEVALRLGSSFWAGTCEVKFVEAEEQLPEGYTMKVLRLKSAANPAKPNNGKPLTGQQ
ncbi:hypothetical protein LTS18_012088, partial [Coniosporium uncinatum]